MRKPNKNRLVEMAICACGCGQKLNKYDERNRIRKYIGGHSCAGWNKGKVMSDVFRKKVSEGHKGQIAWNKGKKGVMPIPWNKGKAWDDIARKKMSFAHKGKHHSPITEFKKGNKPWNRGLLGKNNPFWKENKITPMKQWIRIHTVYQNWRNLVMKRDDYTCQICGERGGNMKIHIDHYPKTFREIIEQYDIKSYEELLEIPELFDINNGRTLCDKCHRLTPTWGGKNIGKGEMCLRGD